MLCYQQLLFLLPSSRFRRGLRSEEHTSELQSHSDLHSFPTRRSSDLTGIASSVSPMRSCAADAMLSAIALLVTLITFPKRSFLPLSSTTEGNPAAPIAIPTVPILSG